jgi:hypothetical protein
MPSIFAILLLIVGLLGVLIGLPGSGVRGEIA